MSFFDEKPTTKIEIEKKELSKNGVLEKTLDVLIIVFVIVLILMLIIIREKK